MFSERLKRASVLNDEDLAGLRETVMAEVEGAVAFARTSPDPAPEELFEDLFA
jgi:pyruvate dehydrogenase E1 component alpha subunit